MRMLKYVLKRIALMFFCLFVITTITFVLIRILPRELPLEKASRAVVLARWEALGYNKPLIIQYGIYWKNILTEWDFGTSWYIAYNKPAWDLMTSRLAPTVLL